MFPLMPGGAALSTIECMRGSLASHTSNASQTSQSDRTPCSQADPELWFAERPADLNVAKALCSACPLKASCLAGALERAEPWGVWGGEILQDGVVLAYKRGRGRPSNADRKLGLVTRVAPDFTQRTRPAVLAAVGQAAGPAEVTTPGTAGTFHSRSA
ncbi:hypothetical protein GCM10023321_21080 [Pseudonocardia eucalypti]|uniref:Transcriptional regulator WhiB n=2 Tax=Pseudonocardia eucalypti TaxID=648755 RepID=A0ABP9PYQ7_9PSEU